MIIDTHDREVAQQLSTGRLEPNDEGVVWFTESASEADENRLNEIRKVVTQAVDGGLITQDQGRALLNNYLNPTSAKKRLDVAIQSSAKDSDRSPYGVLLKEAGIEDKGQIELAKKFLQRWDQEFADARENFETVDGSIVLVNLKDVQTAKAFNDLLELLQDAFDGELIDEKTYKFLKGKLTYGKAVERLASQL